MNTVLRLLELQLIIVSITSYLTKIKNISKNYDKMTEVIPLRISSSLFLCGLCFLLEGKTKTFILLVHLTYRRNDRSFHLISWNHSMHINKYAFIKSV